MPHFPSTRTSKLAAAQPRVEIIEHDRGDNYAADDDLTVILINAQDHNAAADHLDDEGAEDSAQRGTLAARQTGASHHRRRDHIEFVSLSVARGRGAIVANRKQRGDAGRET